MKPQHIPKQILRNICLLFLFFSLVSCTLSRPLNFSSRKEAKAPTKTERHLQPQFLKLLKTVKTRGLTKKELQSIHRKKIKSSDSLKSLSFLILGYHFSNKNLHQKAFSFFSKVDKNHPLYGEANLQSVKILLHLQKSEKALDLISGLLKLTSITEENRAELLKIKYSILSAHPQTSPIKTLKILSDLIEQNPPRKPIYQKKASSILFKLSEATLLDLSQNDFIDSLRSIILYRSGKIMFYRGHFKKSHSYFKQFLELSSHSLLEDKALKFINAIESRNKVNPRHIGVIVPLSGTSQKIGIKYLNGIRMALDLKGSFESEFKIIIQDSQGSPDKAKEAVSKLVIQHQVIAIIAGEVAHVARSIAEEAQNFGVPTVLLSQSPQLFLKGNYIFQNGLSSYNVVESLLNFFITDLKFKNFALLYPNDSYGVSYANTFWNLAESLGGSIKGAQTYKPGESDFSKAVSRLSGIYYIEDREKEYRQVLKQWYVNQLPLYKRKPILDTLLPAKMPFEVLFIPDSAKVLSLVLSHLIYHNINNLVIAGTNLWSTKKWLKKYPPYKGPIFFTSNQMMTYFDNSSAFYQSFVNDFDMPPSFFELSGFESTLAIRQMISFGSKTRMDLQKNLLNAKSLPSPIGPLTISPKGQFIRHLSLYQIENHEITEVKTN